VIVVIKELSVVCMSFSCSTMFGSNPGAVGWTVVLVAVLVAATISVTAWLPACLVVVLWVVLVDVALLA